MASSAPASADETGRTPAGPEGAGALAIIVDSLLRLTEVQQRQQEEFARLAVALRGTVSGPGGVTNSDALEQALAAALERAEQAEQRVGALQAQIALQQEQLEELRTSFGQRERKMAERAERAERRARTLEAQFGALHEQLSQLTQQIPDEPAPA